MAWDAPWWSNSRRSEENLGVEKRIKLLVSLSASLIHGDESLLVSVVDGGLDVDTILHDRGQHRPAVFLAVERGHLRLVDILCGRGCSLSSRDGTGITPLHMAASKGRSDIVQLLLQHGAHIDTPSSRGGNTPLHFAAAGNHHQVAQLLIEEGADVNQQNFEGMTSLMFAANRGNLKTAKTLLDHGADPGHVDKDGNTALLLHCSSVSVSVEMVEMLAISNRLINKTNKQGYTPVLLVATSQSSQSHLALYSLARRGADLSVRTLLGDTPLHLACRQNNWVSAQILVRAGAELDQHNLSGEIPLLLALRQDNLPLARLMRAGGATCYIAPEYYSRLSREAKVWLEEQRKKTKSLKEFSRLVVRKTVPRPLELFVNDADIPNCLKQYINFLLE